MQPALVLCLCALMLSACANRRTTDVMVEDASQVHKLKSGTILSHRLVNVRSDSSGATAIGAMFGGGAASVIGHTHGAALAGLVVGGIAGAFAHRESETGNAVEYTIAISDGSRVLVTQLQSPSETIFVTGTQVSVQLGAKINRVLLAAPEDGRTPDAKKSRNAQAPSRIGVRSCDKGPIGNSTRESCTEH